MKPEIEKQAEEWVKGRDFYKCVMENFLSCDFSYGKRPDISLEGVAERLMKEAFIAGAKSGLHWKKLKVWRPEEGAEVFVYCPYKGEGWKWSHGKVRSDYDRGEINISDGYNVDTVLCDSDALWLRMSDILPEVEK